MNYNKNEINYHDFSTFLQKKYLNKNTHIIGSIASSLIILFDSYSVYGKLEYGATVRQIKKISPLDSQHIIASFNFLRNERLLDVTQKTINGQNELFYFPTELFYNYKNEYIINNETEDNKARWRKWYNDFISKNEIIREFSEYIVQRLENRPTEISHLHQLIHKEIMLLIEEKNPKKIRHMKDKLYIMIDEYARRG